MFTQNEKKTDSDKNHPSLAIINPCETDLISWIAHSIQKKVGSPAKPTARITRAELFLSPHYKIHLDIGGEGPCEFMGKKTGFPNAINVNSLCYTTNLYPCAIPHLVLVENWNTNPSYPFADGFADYITLQNAPLTDKNVEEISRCLSADGEVGLWIDADQFQENIQLLATKLNSQAEWNVSNEFENSDFPKISIIAHRKIDNVETPIPFSQNVHRFPYAPIQSQVKQEETPPLLKSMSR